MLTVEPLISKGFFPKELPPPFTSKSLGDYFANGEVITEAPKPFISECAIHNLSRAGSLRRRLGIINPINYFLISKEITSSLNDIQSICINSPYSKSKPNFTGDRAINKDHSLGNLIKDRIENRCLARFLLKTDIAQFYHSIGHGISKISVL